jgi:hypothetical protein
MLHPDRDSPHGFAAESISHAVRHWQRQLNPFFIDNKEWYLKEEISANKDNMKSLMDFREMPGNIACVALLLRSEWTAACGDRALRCRVARTLGPIIAWLTGLPMSA